MRRTPVALAFAILLALALPPQAQASIVFNKTYSSTATIDIMGETYTLDVGTANVSSIMLTLGNDSIIIGEGNCESFEAELLCHEDKDGTTARLVLYDLRAQLEVEAYYNDTGPFLYGDHLAVVLWMNNTGEEPAAVILAFPLPNNLTVTDSKYCTANATHATWKGTVNEHDEERCLLEFRTDGELDHELRATATYTTFGETAAVNTTPYELEATLPFLFNHTFPADESFEPGQPFTVSFSMHNDQEDNLSITPLEIGSTGDVELISTSINSYLQQSKSVRKNEVLRPGDSFEGAATFKTLIPGTTGTVTISVTYELEDEGVKRTFIKTMPYKSVELHPRISLSPENPSFESQLEAEINVTIHNPYTHYTYKGYDVRMNSALLEEEVLLRVPYGKNTKLPPLRFTAPKTDSTLREELAISVVARTHDNKIITIEDGFPIIIEPLRAIIIEKRVHDDGAGPLSIETVATNKHAAPVTADFEELLPEDVYVRGPTTATTTLRPNEPTTIYTYEVFTDEEPPGELSFITAYAYTYNGLDIADEHVLAVDAAAITSAPGPSAPQEPEQVNTTQPPPPETEAEERAPSLLLVIIIAGFLSLFVIIGAAWEWLRHVHTFKIRHKAIIKQYQELLDKGALLRKRKDEAVKEQELLCRKMALLEKHVQGYDHHLPEELEKLEHQRRELRLMDAVVKERHEKLRERIELLEKKEQQVIDYEKDLAGLISKIDGREQRIKGDRAALHEDIHSLHDDQQRLNNEVAGLAKQQQLLSDRIKHFKARHAANLNSKIRILSRQRKKTMDYHRELEREEELIRDEFKRIEQDLSLSKEDVDRAEKLYKQASLELRKGKEDAKRGDDEGT
ncbi:hypothetical protein JXA12_00720 [Candidatus Woesearchaeota archaeon]|nr:hypothetical protein [Candidatus Woesearchaeota archaeon]